MARNATDNAVFTFRINNDLLILLSNVDNFLILSSTRDTYVQVRNKLTKLFDITTQEGEVINFLNLRIIQSKHAISFDQTQHILDMVEPYFPCL